MKQFNSENLMKIENFKLKIYYIWLRKILEKLTNQKT